MARQSLDHSPIERRSAFVNAKSTRSGQSLDCRTIHWRTVPPDEQRLVTLPSVSIPAPTGEAIARVMLPQQPTLIGPALHAQALIVDPATGPVDPPTASRRSSDADRAVS